MFAKWKSGSNFKSMKVAYRDDRDPTYLDPTEPDSSGPEPAQVQVEIEQVEGSSYSNRTNCSIGRGKAG